MMLFLQLCCNFSMAEVSKRRVFVGGLFPEVTEADLKDRFQRFGKVTSVEVKRKDNFKGMLRSLD